MIFRSMNPKIKKLNINATVSLFFLQKIIEMEQLLQKLYDDFKSYKRENSKDIESIKDKIQLNETMKENLKNLEIEKIKWTKKEEELREEIKELRSDLTESQNKAHDLEKRIENSHKKGKDFENLAVNPRLENIAHNIPNCKIYNTSSQAHKGDSTLEIADCKFKCSFECKSHVKATISKDQILQAINDTKEKEADACLLIYEKLPSYCKGKIYDMNDDEKAIFPLDTSFSRSKMLICMPEHIELAFSILLARHMTSEKITYCLTQERSDIYENLIKLTSYQADLLQPFIASTNIKKLADIDTQVGKIANYLHAESSKSEKCDEKQISINKGIRNIIEKTAIHIKKEGKTAPHMFSQNPTPYQNPRKRQKIDETGFTDTED